MVRTGLLVRTNLLFLDFGIIADTFRFQGPRQIDMSSVMDHRHQEAATLTKAVEVVCRKLVRFLIGKMSLVKLQEIIRQIFVEEIENKLSTENPTKSVSLSQLALLSGLDTRTLTKIRNSKEYRQPLYSETNFLEEFTPGASILDTWCSKEPYIDEKTGKPKELLVSGDYASFEALFNECATSRGITYKSLMKRLLESKSIELNKSTNKLKLKKSSYLPTSSNDYLGAIDMGFSALGNMIDTVTRNLRSFETGEGRFYQRGVWTFRLNESKRDELRRALAKLLESTDNRARKIIERHEDKFSNTDQITAGVSMFYFEEDR